MLVNRRTVTKGLLAGIAAPAILTRPGWAATGPIKIGMLEPMSGPVSFLGDAHVQAAQFIAEKHNNAGGLLGRQVQIVAADSEYKPDVAARRVRDLLRGEQVDFVMTVGGAIAKLVASAAASANRLFVSQSTLPSELTGAEFQPTTFSIAPSTEMYAYACAAYQAKAAPKNIYILCPDYISGRSIGATFRRRFEAVKREDQKVVAEEYFPAYRVTDFGPYITKIIASGADAVVTPNVGPDLRLFLQQGHDLGWKVKVTTLYGNDPLLSKAIGPALIGHAAVALHQITIDDPTNLSTIEAWRKRYPDAPLYNRLPEAAVGLAVSAVDWLLDVTRRGGSLDTATLIKTWEGDRFHTLWGEAQMRACDHQMISGVAACQLMAVNDIPEKLRYYGDAFPYIGPATMIPSEQVAVPPAETGNPRCR